MKLIPENLLKYNKYIKWRMTYKCNYKCEYCIQYRNDCSRRHNDNEYYDKMEVANKIANLIVPGETLIELVGGEISTVNEIPAITKLFHEKGAKIKCLTNLSKDWEFYKYFDCLRASFHPSQCDDVEFKTKLMKLKESGIDVGVECVLSSLSTKENEDKKYSIWKWCEENNIDITVDNDRFDVKNGKGTLKPNQPVHKAYVYIDGVRKAKQELLDEHGNLETIDKQCFNGVDSILIIRDKVSSCDYTRREFKWYDKPTKCKATKCNMARCFCLHLED